MTFGNRGRSRSGATCLHHEGFDQFGKTDERMVETSIAMAKLSAEVCRRHGHADRRIWRRPCRNCEIEFAEGRVDLVMDVDHGFGAGDVAVGRSPHRVDESPAR